MTLTFRGALDRSTVVQAADRVAELVARPEVPAAWDRESSCAGMTVGGLTRHLVGQVSTVVTLLTADRSAGLGAETLDVLAHYTRAPWTSEGPDGEMNTAIRETSDQQAAEGYATAVRLLDEGRATLSTVLRDPAPTTYVPWQGWSLATDDFLVMRLMEMVVHSDDLAASVEVPAPDFGPEVLDPVLRLLTARAVERHGQDALVRALSRPQRAPGNVSAF